jgi:hypothetical protein
MGVAPSRSTPVGSVAVGLGLRADVGLGFSLFSDTSLVSYVYAQREPPLGTVSFGPYEALREALGLAKVW